MGKQAVLDQMNNSVSKNTLMETLDIVFTDFGEDYMVAEMPVTPKVHQPMGILHGGATIALAETVGSAASHMFVNREKYAVKGMELSANHIRSISKGKVIATARPIHKGKKTHLWEVRVEDTEQRLISICKLTMIVLQVSK